mmetsp:Transcript_42728/g.96423  ORF Transcript_42728/g.96423 Transcript_42728/m.96423 type:complete len:846 (+) Transcript_42728:51-2588(+)
MYPVRFIVVLRCAVIVDGCSFLATNFAIDDWLLVKANRLNRLRGPDATNHVTVRGWTLVHNLLWMTGEFTKQPFVERGPKGDVEYAVLFNGEVYNYQELWPTRRFPSDGYSILPAYHEWGSSFGKMLDGEFAIVLLDFKGGKLHLLTDVFGTKPLFFGWGANGEFAAASYRSVLSELGLPPDSIFQAAANTLYSSDLDSLRKPPRGGWGAFSRLTPVSAAGPLLVQHPVFRFDLRQHKQTSDDWIAAFQRAVAKRTRGLIWPAFVGLSSGYDSGAIHLALILANVSHSTFSIVGHEDSLVLQKREQYGNGQLHTEIRITNYSRKRHITWVKDNVEAYEYVHPSRGQSVHSDPASIGLSHILERCRGLGVKVYFSGSGADEIISDYAFNGEGMPTSNFNGIFPQNLSSIFPWGNFYSGQMKNYLMKEENVGGSYSMETRYPFLDRQLVQEYISLSADLKNSRYKRPIRDFFEKYNYPFQEEKRGFSVEVQRSSGTTTLNLDKCVGCCIRPSAVASSKPRVAIASALFTKGRAHSRPLSEFGMPMFLFTDQNITEGPWQVIRKPYHISADILFPWLNAHGRHSWANITKPGIASVMAAKFYKMNAYLLPELASYDIIVWVDSNYVIRRSPESFTKIVIARLGDADILMAHHFRWTVQSELLPAWHRAAENMGELNTTYSSDVQEAYDHQVKEGFVDAHGLYYGAFFAYRPRAQRVQSALQAWWHEVQLYTFRDQISFPFIVSTFDLCVATGSYHDVVCSVLGTPQFDRSHTVDMCNFLDGYVYVALPSPAEGMWPRAAATVTGLSIVLLVCLSLTVRYLRHARRPAKNDCEGHRRFVARRYGRTHDL